MSVLINWNLYSKYTSEQYVYRSETPFDKDSLPAKLATISPYANSYTDDTALVGTTYYYMVVSYRPTPLTYIYSNLMEAAVTDTGPGPTTLLGGDSVMGFFGEVPATSFATRASISSLAGVTAGTVNNLEDAWLKFVLDGKILFVHKNNVRYNLSWDNLNSANAIYGSKVVTILGKQYKIRLLKGADTDPYVGAVASGYDIVGSRNSEWSRLFYPLVIDDANIVSYDGPKLASYTNLDLGMVTVTGAYSWCQETLATNVANRVRRGYNGVFFLGTRAASTGADHGWRPALELV